MKHYGYDCDMCHGTEGNGKGDVAAGMNLKMHDYTNPATLKDRTDEELFCIINNGKGDMPLDGDRVTPEQMSNMINYIRSFAKPADQNTRRRQENEIMSTPLVPNRIQK